MTAGAAAAVLVRRPVAATAAAWPQAALCAGQPSRWQLLAAQNHAALQRVHRISFLAEPAGPDAAAANAGALAAVWHAAAEDPGPALPQCAHVRATAVARAGAPAGEAASTTAGSAASVLGSDRAAVFASAREPLATVSAAVLSAAASPAASGAGAAAFIAAAASGVPSALSGASPASASSSSSARSRRARAGCFVARSAQSACSGPLRGSRRRTACGNTTRARKTKKGTRRQPVHSHAKQRPPRKRRPKRARFNREDA